MLVPEDGWDKKLNIKYGQNTHDGHFSRQIPTLRQMYRGDRLEICEVI